MSKRKNHTLRPNKRQTFPRHVIYYDNESILHTNKDGDIYHTLRLGVAQYIDYERPSSEDEIVYHTAEEFWNWVDSKTLPNRTLYIIAHNQDFDFRLVEGFSNLQRLKWFTHKLIIDYPRFICTFGTIPKVDGKNRPDKLSNPKTPRKYITCLDSLNWFRESLKQLGETVNAPKLEMPNETDTEEKWIIYCRQDVVVLRLAVEQYIQFLKQYNLGTFAPTTAKQAVNAFKTNYMTHEIHIHTDERAIAIERRAYSGGRTECFKIGMFNSEQYYKLDINSMYPYVMESKPYPTKFLGIRYNELPEEIEALRQKHLYIADVHIETEIPCVPYRTDSKLLFPIGSFHTTLCQPEIELLEQLNISYKIERIAFYEGHPIFSNFVNSLYTLRQKFKSEQNDQYQYFTKILMNSLYGKFGQRNESWERIGHDGTNRSKLETYIDGNTGIEKTIKIVCGEWFEKKDTEEGYDSMVAIAAFVTSYSRRMLYEFILQADQDNVYYSDTDSLFVNKKGLDNLSNHIDPTRLGALKIEDQTEHMEIRNLKDYTFGNELKIKGVSKKAKQLSQNKYEVEQWEHFNGAVQRDRTELPITKKVIKILRRTYEKGIVQPDGTVHPYTINE